MKNTTKLYFILIFFGFFSFHNAQESKEILDLKAKLSRSKSDKELIDNLSHVADYYRLRGNYDSAYVYTVKMRAVFEKQNDQKKVLRINVLLIQFPLQKGDLPKTKELLDKYNKDVEKSTDYFTKGIYNVFNGFYNVAQKNDKEAKKYFQKNIDLYNQGKDIDKNLVMQSYQGLFSNSFSQSNTTESFDNIIKYKDFVLKNFPDRKNIAYNMLGIFYLLSGDTKKSIPEFKKSLQYTDKKNVLFVSNLKSNIGVMYIKSKQLDSAKIYLKEAERNLENLNYPVDLSRVYSGLSMLYKEEKQYDIAESYINKALKLIPDTDLESLNVNYKTELYSIQLSKILADSLNLKNNPAKISQLQEVTNNLTTHLELQKKTIASDYSTYETMTDLSKANEYLGNYEVALKYLKDSKTAYDKVYGLDKVIELSNKQADYELISEKARIKLEEENKRIRLQKEIELKALRFEYEKKQSLAKTEEEKKRLMLEEEMKRKEIELVYMQRQKSATLKFQQERQIAKINQEKKDAVTKAEIQSSKTQKNMWALGAGLSLLLLGFAGFSYYQKRKDNQKIAEEKQKSDDLLLNILPYEVAEELKEKGKTSAKHYDEVSVLFTDFVNFTSNSEKLGVQEVLNELNICFTEFDKITEKNGLEKIKTIGDAYLAVSGLPVSNEQHAQNAVKAGLEILDFIQRRRSVNPNALDIRIGIHSGPVIAGIVGVKKFAYDIWGDTVNTAARMEQNSEKGKLNISGSTFNLVKEKFFCEYRGKIDTKGKGALDMYFVKNLSKF